MSVEQLLPPPLPLPLPLNDPPRPRPEFLLGDESDLTYESDARDYLDRGDFYYVKSKEIQSTLNSTEMPNEAATHLLLLLQSTLALMKSPTSLRVTFAEKEYSICYIYP
jgi:hypothetical protein